MTPYQHKQALLPKRLRPDDPPACGARHGDILHVRSRHPYGWAIRRIIPSWGNHDAILVYLTAEDTLRLKLNATGWAVAEATLSGYTVTPWTDYLARIRKNNTGVLFLRPTGIPAETSHRVGEFALQHAADPPEYDLTAIWSIFRRAVFGRNTTRQKHNKFYCTEDVAYQHHRADDLSLRWDVWDHTSLPTPYTTEKRLRTGSLQLVNAATAPAWYTHTITAYDLHHAKHPLTPNPQPA